MALWHGPIRWLLILLALGLASVGAAALVLGPTLGLPSTQDHVSSEVKATVVATSPCGPQARDTVEVPVNGAVQQLPLDGCGHAKGETVEVVISTAAGQPLAQLASTSQVGGNRYGRLTAVLLSVSALAGALYAFLIRQHRWDQLFARAFGRMANQ